jgi:hypothetical protein
MKENIKHITRICASVVTWWEHNQTDNVPVSRISTDAGETFGSMLTLAANGTIGEAAEEEEPEEGG